MKSKIKVVGFVNPDELNSGKGNLKVYASKSSLKGAITRAKNAEYKGKLDNLKSKFNG